MHDIAPHAATAAPATAPKIIPVITPPKYKTGGKREEERRE